MADVLLYVTDTGTAFASSASCEIAGEIAARTGDEVHETCGGAWGTHGPRAVVEPAARAVAAERGLSLRTHCSRCRDGACGWHGRRGCDCAECAGRGR